MPSQLRFIVGSPTGVQSTSWKVWTNAADVYLMSRAAASTVKVSLHASGACQFSRTSEWARTSTQANAERHLEKWRRRDPHPESGAVHLFRIVFPGSELRSAVAGPPLRSTVHWLPAPPPESGTYVELWLTPALTQPPQREQFSFPLVGVLPLPTQQFVAVTAHSLLITPEDLSALASEKDRAAATTRAPDPRVRGWFLAVPDDGPHAIVEFAPFCDAT